ncbi:MAG: lysophospholipid acyltransferase family protein [Acidimicrobiales bacterium]|jgi:1-acyl-sn-glycerol-3-phosphate acyltransferase
MSSSGMNDPREANFTVTAPEIVYKAVKGLAGILCRLYFRVRITGRQIPETGPIILAPVHRSFLDFLIVGTTMTKRKVYFMAKDDLWKSKPLGAFLNTFGAFPVNRDGTDRLALDRAQAVLERGDVLIMFPEGTRRTGPKIEDLHEGVAFLAARTGTRILPIGVGGTSAAMPKGAKIPRPVKVTLVVGDFIDPPEKSGAGRVPRTKVHAVTEELRSELQNLYEISEPA